MIKILLIAVVAAVVGSGQAVARPAAADLVTVRAWCPMTGASGIGRDAVFTKATKKAIDQCITNGGQPACCYKFNRQI